MFWQIWGRLGGMLQNATFLGGGGELFDEDDGGDRSIRAPLAVRALLPFLQFPDSSDFGDSDLDEDTNAQAGIYVGCSDPVASADLTCLLTWPLICQLWLFTILRVLHFSLDSITTGV